MKLKFSMMTSSLANQGLGAREIVDAAVKLGFSGIDWLTNYDGASEALKNEASTTLRRLCEDAGLPIVGYIFFADYFIRQQAGWRMIFTGPWKRLLHLGHRKSCLPPVPCPGKATAGKAISVGKRPSQS